LLGYAAAMGKWSAAAREEYATKEWTVADYEVPGFAEALTEALRPHVGQEADVREFENKVAKKLMNAAKKFNKDERRDCHGTPYKAQEFVEEFCDNCLGALSGVMYDKPWAGDVNYTGPLLALALFTFDGAKIFRRTVGPMIEKFVEEGIFKFREEERIQRVMEEAIESAAVKEAYKKKAVKHLGIAYDESHFKSPYSTVTGETPEIGHLKAFVKGWMSDFAERAWDILENGVGQGTGSSRDEMILFMTVLFQALADAKDPCLPHDLVSAAGAVPPGPWSYVAEVAEAVFREMDERAEQSRLKKAKLVAEGLWEEGPWNMGKKK